MVEEHKFFDFLGKHWSKLLLGFLAVASFIVWSERFFASNHSQLQQDFLMGNQILERFHKGEPLAVESIEVTEKIVQRHPELHSKYAPMLTMTYLAARNPSKALPYAKATFNHVIQDLSPYYQSYAKTSFLIAEKHYERAYQQAQDLCIQLQDHEPDSTLYAMNLLRLASLEREMGIHTNAWEKLKEHPTYTSIASFLQEGNLSLEDWHLLHLNN